MNKTISTICAAALAATATFSAATLSSTAPAAAQSLTIDFSNGQPTFQIQNGVRYYRGYRGYTSPRPGYRMYNGYYFPSAAFVEREERRDMRRDNRNWDKDSRQWAKHVDYCYDRYKSYRESDNTFQPYKGPRQECRSPYYG